MKFQNIATIVIAAGALTTGALTARPAHAWGEVGHKVVARIAWDNMSPATRAKLIALLDAAPKDADLASLRPAGVSKEEGDRVLFETAATWPDIVRARKTDTEKARNTKYHHGPWHYYDIFLELDPATGLMKERTDKQNDPENAIAALQSQSALLQNATAAPGDRAVAIAWLEHVVGDLHMPLHNVARITATEPNGDQGGNLVKLEPPKESGFQKNLHGFWDDLPDSQFPAQTGENPEARIARIAGYATAALPKQTFERAGLTLTGQYLAWNREGAEVAVTRVYPGITPNQLPDAAYTTEAKDSALVGLAKAGYRLAATLEAALK